LLRPKAEQLRIGIVADIAAVTVMTKATASSVQMHEAAGAKVPQNTPFGVLLLQLAQFATPANAADQPAAIAETATVPDEAAKNDPKSAAAVPQAGGLAAVLTAATSITSDAQATIQDVPQKAPGARPAVKGDQKKAPDADSNPKIAPDADLVAALTQQTQAATIQPEIVQAQADTPQDNATTAATVVAAGAAPVASDAKPTSTPVQTQSGKDAAATSDQTAGPNQAGTANSGGATSDAPVVDASKADTKGNEGPGRAANTPDATPVQNAQSSVSGQSASASPPSVTATAVPAQIQTANTASVNVNFQVAPQHQDSTSTPIMDTLGLTIAAKSADGIKHFDIRLDPPELGRVQVHLSLDDSGKARASLVVDKPQTLELLQRDAAGLTRSLADAGVSLSNNGLNFSLRGKDRQSDGSVVKGRSRVLSVKAVVGTDAISNSSAIASLAPDSVRLDIRV
jgi:flagellar hook-length control protein FliK